MIISEWAKTENMCVNNMTKSVLHARITVWNAVGHTYHKGMQSIIKSISHSIVGHMNSAIDTTLTTVRHALGFARSAIGTAYGGRTMFVGGGIGQAVTLTLYAHAWGGRCSLACPR